MLETVKDMLFLKNLLQDDVYAIDERKRYPLLIIVDSPQQEYMPESDEIFLEKILQAVKVKLDEARVINLSFPEPEDYYDTIQEVPATKVISFAGNLSKLNISVELEKYQLKIQDGIIFLLVDSLHEISESIDKKKLLWTSLQRMFL